MPYSSSHRFLLLFSILSLSSAGVVPAACQSDKTTSPPSDEPAAHLQVRSNELVITISFSSPIEKPVRGTAKALLLNPENMVRAQVEEPVSLQRQQKEVVVHLVKPFEKVPAAEMAVLHWLRVKYEVKTESGAVLAAGFEALHTDTTDPFVLTAAASRVAAEGRAYRAQVHVRTSQGRALAGIEVLGDLSWDENAADDKKLRAKATTNTEGNATLSFQIPHGIHGEDGELAISARHGLVARSVEREVTFWTPSYLLLDTDKDIYQPGQTLHMRMLRFDSERKALNNDSLDIRIQDEERTLVFKQSVPTDAFGVGHLDWQVPPNLLQGTYSIHVGLTSQDDVWRAVQASKSVRIYRYELPNFRVSARPDKNYYLPGQNADVTVSAEYLFGRPVTRGTVKVVEETTRTWNFRKQKWEVEEGQVRTGELDHDGRFTTHFDLSSIHDDLESEDDEQFHDVKLAAYVTDVSTGRTEQRRFELRATKNPIHVYLSPSPWRDEKWPVTFYVSTFYADGSPARCKVQLSIADEDDAKGEQKKVSLRWVHTNKYGLAKVNELAIPEDADRDSLLVEARDAKGLAGRWVETLYDSSDDHDLIEVSASHALYKTGEPIEVTLRSTRPAIRLVVDAVREGVVLASQQVKMRNGRGYATFPYDPRFTDEVTVYASTLEEDWPAYSNLEGWRTVLYPKNRQLDVAVQLDKNEHRPGEETAAHFAVRSADKTAAESALGVKIVDRAVEERAQTDSDFGQSHDYWGSWRWSLWSSQADSSFSGVTRDDLDHVNLAEPISPDLDLVGEYILQSSYRDALELLEDRSRLAPEEAFSTILTDQFVPLEIGLRKWNDRGKLAHDLADLQAAGQNEGIDVKGLRDPWGTPYRYELTLQGQQQILTVTSAGPDKRFGTKDDFTARRLTIQFFAYYGKLIDLASHDLNEKEGRFIRDLDTLQTELLKRGVDFKTLRDPWGLPYEARFEAVGSFYAILIFSHGEHPEQKGENVGSLLWRNQVDYFVRSRETINKVLRAHLNTGGSYPNDEETFKSILRKAGVDLDELRDPWGHLYYVVFQRAAHYGDRIKIQQTASSGQRVGEPVTLVRQEVHVMSVGPDGQRATADDFQVASYSILLSAQSAKDSAAHPAPTGMSLAANTGALTGTVVDPTGAVIANATVQAAHEGGGEKYSALTDSSGHFELKDLPPGVYDVLALARGFQTLQVQSVLVEAANVTEVSFELSVGASVEVVEVAGAPVTLETTSSSVAAVQGLPALATAGPRVNVVTKSAVMSTPRLRQDFPETMLWEPALVTDRRGRAKLNFKLADNITTWKLTAVGSTKNGELGRAEKDLLAFQPFFVEHDPPRILTQGDEISYPLVLRNYLDRAQTLQASIKPESWFTLVGPGEMPVKVDAGDYARAVFKYRAVAAVANGKQQVKAANTEISDAAQKPVDVHPFGRPVSATAAGIVDRKGALSISIPEGVIEGSIQARVKIYPNLLSHVVENLEAGLEKPHGCGEQTISSTYPSLLVAEIYARSGEKSAVALKAQRYLASGYERLLRYQAESGGFTYWGRGETADLALTAYALEFLNHAAELVAVDDGVIRAAERWMLDQQDKDGSWRNGGAKNDQYSLLWTAYIAQTLAQLDEKHSPDVARRHKSLEQALTFLGAHRDLADEPYVIASYALAAKATGNQQVFRELLEWIRKNVHQQASGAYWKLERNTPFYGWGHTGELESTSMAVRVLAANGDKDEGDEPLIRHGLLFLLRNQERDGMWYSGQTTVNVLKTLLSLVALRTLESGAGKLTARVNGRDAQVVDLPAGNAVAAPIEIDVGALVARGENQLELQSTGEGMMSAQFAADFYVPWEDNSTVTARREPNATSALRYAVEYSNTKGTTSESVDCKVRAERIGYMGFGMMLAEAGLPPGADVDRDSLEQALEGNYSVYRYEVEPDRVVLYLWPEAGGAAVSFRFRPRFAMQAETGPSVLYDYYNPDASVTLKPTQFNVDLGKKD